MYHLQVLGKDGHPISMQPVQLSKDHKKMNLNVPDMPDGIYTVTYNILSVDGHPVEGSYTFLVGEVPAAQAGSSERSLLPDRHESAGLSNRLFDMLQYAVRSFYLLSLLCLAGWMFWAGRSARDAGVGKWPAYRARWLQALQRCFLTSLAAVVFLQLMQTYRIGGWAGLPAWLMTVQGESSMLGLLFGFVSILLYRRSARLGIGGIVLVLAAESFNGHAAALHPAWAIPLDGIHLLAAAIWAGGLLYLLVHYRISKEHARTFLPRFSVAALASIGALAVTGAASAWIYLPKLEYVLASAWGRWLMVKTGCVLLVVLTGALLRSRIKRSRFGAIGGLLKIDFSLMVLIMGIVGVFTMLSPSPSNHPFHWEEAGKQAVVTADIVPFTAGANRFLVQVRLPDRSGSAAPMEVRMMLRHEGVNTTAPIEIPLTRSSDNYRNDEAYIPFPGTWEIEIRMMDADDEETVYRKTQTIY